MNEPVALEGARCAVHPEISAGFVCTRCGNFGCESCRAPGGSAVGLCNACGGNGAREIRQAHIKHEHSVRSIGSLYLLSSFMFVASFTSVAFVGGRDAPNVNALWFKLGFLALALVGGGMAAAIGIGIRRLQPWARAVASIFSGVGLIGVPIGTLIHGYILYLMWSARGKVVFSPEYQQVIATTPDIRYRSSIFVWVLFIVLVLLLAAAAAFAIMNA